MIGSCAAVLGLSLHLGFNEHYNFVNPGYKCDIREIIYGSYLNSEGNISIFLGKEINNHTEFGLVTGYSGGQIVPIVRLKYKKFFVMPGYDGRNGIALGIEIPIGE